MRDHMPAGLKTFECCVNLTEFGMPEISSGNTDPALEIIAAHGTVIEQAQQDIFKHSFPSFIYKNLYMDLKYVSSSKKGEIDGLRVKSLRKRHAGVGESCDSYTSNFDIM